MSSKKIPLGRLGAGPADVVREPDSYSYFSVKENGYNSCSPLSYVVISGGNGDSRGPAGTGASIHEAVVFFHYDQLTTNPAPFEMKEVTSINQTSANAVTVKYGHAGRTTAEGVTEYYTLTFSYGDKGLTAQGSLPQGIDHFVRLYLR